MGEGGSDDASDTRTHTIQYNFIPCNVSVSQTQSQCISNTAMDGG